ncbi:hypothetical protein [Halobellus salinus]|uniref:hypothetical protein n=1 Tax=Halobellus salinus TaxID=931585 RepID=UPI001663CF8D|nr:hypothetical protein [Halobellus salinus]
MADPIVWLYNKGPKHQKYHRTAIEEAHYSQDLKSAIKNGDVDPDIPVDLDEFGPISIILPRYHTNSLHDNVRAGSIIFFFDTTIGEYYAASILLGTGRNKDRSFVSTIWPYDQPAKTYLVITTQPISIELSENRFRNLFGYKKNQDPLSGQKTRYLIAPASNHQNEFKQNIISYEEFFKSIRSSRDLDFNWVERKSQFMQEIFQTG